MTDRITADILVEAFDLARPDFDDLKDRIEEAAAAHKATVTADGRLSLAQQPTEPPVALPAPADVTMCICGHPVRLHFEDACQDCDCGDCMEPAEALETIRRLVRAARENRLALSQALNLGTGAPWDAIHERVDELRRLAAEAQQQDAPAKRPPMDPVYLLGIDASSDQEAADDASIVESSETVGYVVLSRQPDGTWEGASGPMDDPDVARERMARRRALMPDLTLRLAQRTTNSVLRILPEAGEAS
ncbi:MULTISPECIES: hypothetical protein [unclassified Streptomyces]|uniref:hypothetical protein n=1 Tax=unclassified Streptomyces TaxID=2593676 RepID=UPI0033EEA126